MTKKNNKKKRTKTIKKKKYDRSLSNLSKSKITRILYNSSKEDLIKDFESLKEISCDNINVLSKQGSVFVNHFTAIERLDTKGRRGVTFFDTVLHFNTF